jgi:hypothetical protein
LIARSARAMDRGAGLPADLRSVPEPVAGGEVAVAVGACSRPSSGSLSTSSVVCSIVKGPSPHSVPIRSPCGSILRNRGSESVPVRSPLSSSPCLGAGSAPGNSDFCRRPVRGGRNSMGTQPEPIGDMRRRPRRGGQAAPRFDRFGEPSRRYGSGSGPSPKQRRAPAPKRDALKGENPGSLRATQVRRLWRRRSFRRRGMGAPRLRGLFRGRERGGDPRGPWQTTAGSKGFM